MLIGYNQICINPIKPTFRVGMFIDHNPMLNVRGDLYARCLRLKSPSFNIILLVFDSLGISSDIQKQFEEKIKETIKEDVLFIFSSTHTHYAPALCNLHGLINVDKPYFEYTTRKVALMIKNCRMVDKDISINYSWEQFDQVGKTRINNKPNDNVYAGVMSFYDNHSRLGNILFYNCHPTTPQDDANYFTSAFVGSAVEKLTKKYPGEFFIYLQGADGDISTRLNRTCTKYEEVTRLGNKMSDQFIKLLGRNQNIVRHPLTINFSSWNLQISNKLKNTNSIDIDQLIGYTEKEIKELKTGIRMISGIKDKVKPFKSKVTFSLLELNGYRLLFNPFELFSDYNNFINKENTLLVCYSQGLQGYLTQPDNDHISYEYLIETQNEEDKRMSLKRLKNSLNNPFFFSDDNLRYHSYSYYLKHKYHQKVFKVPLNAGFTCPNRDGTCGINGCFYCGSKGSGDTIIDSNDLNTQFIEGKKIMLNKWPNGKAIAYFQAFSNTYSSLEHLKEVYQPFINDTNIIELAIATRPDCLDQAKINYFAKLNKQKPITIELGLQSIHDKTMKKMNRGHDLDCLNDIVYKLKQANIRTCLHIINGLPNETSSMMIQTAKHVASLKVDGIKIHMLQIIKGAILADIYLNSPFELLNKEDYVKLVIKQLEILPQEMVIERLTGDAIKDTLIAPLWTIRKTSVLNDIAKEMVKQDTYQGRYYETD